MQNIKISLWLLIFTLMNSMRIIKCVENCEFDVQNGPATPFYIFPDDVRMAQIRCAEISQGNDELKKLWKNNEFPNDISTHCYIKCYLKRLGLINLITRGLDHDKLYQLWDNMDLETTDFCLGELDLSIELDDRCASYYNKWLHLRNNCAELIENSFYELGPTFQYPRKFQLRTKPLGMSAMEFCESMDNEEIEIDAAERTDDLHISSEHDVDKLKFQIACIFKRFYYFDAYGRLDPTEVIRSFNDVVKLVENREIVIRDCTHHANAKYLINSENSERDMAYDLYKCLLERFGQQFHKVMNQRNKLTMNI